MTKPKASRTLWFVLVTLVAGGIALLPAGAALASPQVTMPAGNPHNNQTWTVTGSGFPSRSSDPAGVQILECADPHGNLANLPTSASSCDGATQDPLPVYTDAAGNITDRYTFVALSGLHGTSNIACNATNYCVLWIGVDYNNEFLGGPHAFSNAFRIGAASPAAGGSSAGVWIVIAVVVVLGGGALVVVRRRRATGATPPSAPEVPADSPPVRT